MPAPRLDITIRNANVKLKQLESYKNDSISLPAKYQHFIAEMIMLRLFTIFEDVVAEIAYKLASGATYINGNIPSLNVRANSISAARGNFLTVGLLKPKQNLKWTKAKYIRESVQNVIPITETYIINAQIHGSTIEEMRNVRNVLAHKTSSATADFRSVIRQKYGANIPMTTGAFLTTTHRHSTCNLNRYISSTRIILHSLASGI